jgi:hypothetical protein
MTGTTVRLQQAVQMGGRRALSVAALRINRIWAWDV